MTALAEKTMEKVFGMANREFITRNCLQSCPWFSTQILDSLMSGKEGKQLRFASFILPFQVELPERLF